MTYIKRIASIKFLYWLASKGVLRNMPYYYGQKLYRITYRCLGENMTDTESGYSASHALNKFKKRLPFAVIAIEPISGEEKNYSENGNNSE